MSPRNIGGPILIAQMAGQQAQEGLGSFLAFLAVLSINLGVLNLLPVPVLDGGHLLFFLVEAVIAQASCTEVSGNGSTGWYLSPGATHDLCVLQRHREIF